MLMAETTLDTELQQKADSQTPVSTSAQRVARVTNSEVRTPAATAHNARSIQLNPPARQVAVMLGFYAIFISGGLWASINLLRWFWHRLL